MDEDKHLSGRIIFDGKKDNLMDEAKLSEPCKGGKVSDWKSTSDASIRAQSNEVKKHFGVDILPYENNEKRGGCSREYYT